MLQGLEPFGWVCQSLLAGFVKVYTLKPLLTGHNQMAWLTSLSSDRMIDDSF